MDILSLGIYVARVHSAISACTLFRSEHSASDSAFTAVQGKEEVHVGLACLELSFRIRPFLAVGVLPSRGREANVRGSGNSGRDPGAHGS